MSLCSDRGSPPHPSLAPSEEETVLSVDMTFGFEKVNSAETDGPLSDELAHGLGRVGACREVRGPVLEEASAAGTGVGAPVLLTQKRTVLQVASLRHSRKVLKSARSHPAGSAASPPFCREPRQHSPRPLIPFSYCG